MASFADTLMKGFRTVHVSIYRASSGKLGGSMLGSPVLLLTVIGRKSGKSYTMPLGYIFHNGEYLITASAAGAEKNPVWFSNLSSRPEAKIEVKGKTYTVKVVITEGAERDQLYELFKAQASNFAEYEKKTPRKIPVIRLQPTSAN